VLAWLLWRLERIERIHAAAGVLISEFGVEAGAEARRREREASNPGTARDWKSVAWVVARRVSRGASDAATRPPLLESGPVAESTLVASGQPQAYRIQFVCGTPDQGATNLTEKRIEAEDASAAIVAAASAKWPPRTIGLRILDREGREVFARQKANRK
jgi:hypothetical protein